MVFTVPFGFQPRSVNAVWGRDVVAVLVLEIALSAAALVIGFAVQARKKDFVYENTMNTQERLHALDAVRAFALLLGIVFHAGFSFIPGMIPGIWAIVDTSPSTAISAVLFTSHIFRMSLFFFIAGFFARMMFHRKGPRGFWSDRARRILVPLVVGWMVLFPSIAIEGFRFIDPLMAAVVLAGVTVLFGGLAIRRLAHHG